MKGRGTRKCDFLEYWITKSEIPDETDGNKKQFLLFDFFGNYEYFEKEFVIKVKKYQRRIHFKPFYMCQ